MKAEIVRIKPETPQPKVYTWGEIKDFPGRFFQNVEPTHNNPKYVPLNDGTILYILVDSSAGGRVMVEVAAENTYQTEASYFMNEDCENLVLTFGQ